MRRLIRPLTAAVYISCLVVFNLVTSTDGASAQDQAAPSLVQQMALTKKQIEGVLTAQSDPRNITGNVGGSR